MNLYLEIEVLNREFQSKLLIAMESASRGMNVYMGRLKQYIMRDFFTQGIILDKSITPAPHRLKEMEYCKKKNFIYTSLDEEVGLVNKDNYYLRQRFSNQSLKLADKVFCWGEWDYTNLKKKFNKYKKKFVLSGNPRLDYWRKDFDFFYKKRKLKYNNYILFSLNFAHFLNSKSEFNKHLKFLVDTKYVNRGLSINKAKISRKRNQQIYKKFSKLITELSKKTDLEIIVRPHPTDPIKNYDFLKKYKNVSVIKNGNISEWIHYAKVVVHSGCTGGLEAAIRDIPTVSYCPPLISPHGHEFANAFSKKTKNLSECIKTIQKITKNELKFKKFDLNKIRLRAHNLSSKKPSYKIIVDEFEKLKKEKKILKKNNDLLLKFKFKIRDFRSKILNLKYGNIKFSIFKKDETVKVFEILKDLDPKFRNLKLNFIKKDIIQVKRSD
jgi:surface carbohydrate biosynthesis protein